MLIILSHTADKIMFGDTEDNSSFCRLYFFLIRQTISPKKKKKKEKKKKKIMFGS